MPRIVQFTHPGPEAAPSIQDKDTMPWNTGAHKRKFLHAQGQYMENGSILEEDLVFWGEWEPPSRVTRLPLPHEPDFPTWIYTPQWPSSPPPNGQNTDPNVFNGCFKYFLCRQHKRPFLTQLERGSIILFGSGKKPGNAKEAHFQLDTVFVVGDYIDYDTNQTRSLDDPRIDRFYRKIAFQPSFENCGGSDEGVTLRLYFGATPDNRCDDMYSFVPAQIYKPDGRGFPRVRLRDIDYITNRLNIGAKNSHASREQCQDYWYNIRKITRQQGCLEGVAFAITSA